jgi:hypothetical protein
MTRQEFVMRAISGLVFLAAGVFLVARAGGWEVCLGVFLMLWGNNSTMGLGSTRA